MAEPGGTVRKVICPVAGESTLKAPAAEAAAIEARHRARCALFVNRTNLRSALVPLVNVTFAARGARGRCCRP